MKRKGRKNKTVESPSNGVQNNGTSNELNGKEEKKAASKRKSSAKTSEDAGLKNRSPAKRKSGIKKVQVESEPEEEETQYEVEEVLDEKNIRGVTHFLIRWRGYEPESDTWEPESTLNCPELINDFKAKSKKRPRSGSSKSPKKKTVATPKDQENWDENENFEVDRILDVYFKKNGKREFLVSWKGYPLSQSSWEPEENMDCKDLIKKYMEKVEKAKETDQRELRIKRTHTDRLTLMMDQKVRRLSKRNEGRQRVHYHDAE